MQDFRMDTFLAVCRQLNYTRAAEELNITQPAVSQHIRFLEQHHGVRLFSYEGKKLRLTRAGALLRSAAITGKHDEGILLRQMHENGRENLAFGATRTIGDFVLPGRLARYITEHPETDVRMPVDNTENLLRRLDGGELEFAVIEGYFPKSEYDYEICSSEHYIAVCAPGYFFSREPERLSDLFGERILLREPGSGSREIFERHIREQNCSLQDFPRTAEIGSIHAIKALTAAGCGVTFLFEAAVRQELRSGLLRRIPLADFNAMHSFTAVWRKSSRYQGRYREILSLLLRGQTLPPPGIPPALTKGKQNMV